MYNDDRMKLQKEIIPKNTLFTINKNYNTTEVNKMMKSSKNIFTHISPLLTETLTSFTNKSKGYNLKTIATNSIHNKKYLYFFRNKKSINLPKPKSHTNYLKTHSNLHSIDNEFTLGPLNPPSINDKEILTSFYKISDDNDIISNKSPEEKLLRDKLFEKYNIKKDRYMNMNLNNNLDSNNNMYNISTQNNFYNNKGYDNMHYRIAVRYFQNLNKANKIIDINKQLVKRVNEMSNFFLLQKYAQTIEKNQMKKFYERKMPKVHIKLQAKKPKYLKESFDLDQMDYEEENEPVKKLSKKKTKDFFQEKKINSLGSIKFGYFRKIAYNGLIEPELIEDKEITEQKGEEGDNDKKKEIERLRKLNKIERHYLSLVIKKKLSAFKPNSRIDFSISQFGNKIYLYGGFSSKIYNELWTYNMDTNKWNLIKNQEKEEPNPRKGHTSIIIKNTLFIYGGESSKDISNEDIITYNILMNKYYSPKISKKKKLNQRKGHIMIGTNQTFLIQGGLDVRTLTIENSAYVYNVLENYWEKLDYKGKHLPYRAYHCGVMVNSYMNHTLSTYTFYSLPDDINEDNKSKLKYEGIYIFGGINEKKMYCNDLYIIKTGKRPCVNIKPKIAGKPPEPRIHGKMLFLENYFFIIIQGGIKADQNFCDDIAVLNLENYNWIKPIIDDERGTSNKLIGRVRHEIFFNNEKLYIFGGLGEDNLLSFNFEIVEFEVTGFLNKFMFPDN
jgi:hypothetical protein